MTVEYEKFNHFFVNLDVNEQLFLFFVPSEHGLMIAVNVI